MRHHSLPGRFTTALAATAVTALALTACSGGGGESTDADSGGLTTLKVATIGLTSDGSLMTGIEQGFFEDEGLEIEVSIVANPPAGLAAAQSGQVDIAYSPSIPVLNALSQGVGIQVIGGADGFAPEAAGAEDPADFDDTGLFASEKSGITSVDELEGKTIAIPARKAQMEVVIANELEEAGIDQNSVEWVVLDFTSAVAALENGTVDAAGLVSPFTSEALDQGSPQLAAPSLSFFEDGAVGLWTAGSSTIEKKKDAIDAFQRAILKSNEYANENPEEAIQAGLDYTKSDLEISDVKLPFWPLSVEPVDLERPNEKLVRLGFLDSPVDLDGVIYEG